MKRVAYLWIITSTFTFVFLSPARASQRQELHGHIPAVVTKLNLQPIGTLPATNRLQLAIGLPLRDQAALTRLLQDLYNPASPRFHHYLTPQQFTEMFGPAEADYQALINFARTNGLQVVGTYGNRIILDVSGAVSDIDKTFHVALRTYHHPTEARQFFAPDVEPSVDTSVPILHVSGLENYAIPRRAAPMQLTTGDAIPGSGSGPSGRYMGNDYRNAYVPNVTLNGSNQMVGLLELDGYYTNDITTYESKAGLPNVTLTNILLDGVSGVPSSVLEAPVDIEQVISMAPNLAAVVVFEGSSWDDILSSMAANNQIKQFSSSWFPGSINPDTTGDQIYQQMIAQGQSFFQASGDADAWCGGVFWPASDPYVTSVGGTELTMNGSGASYASETVWNFGYDPPGWYGMNSDYIGSGGGVSAYYPIPTWQQNVNMTAVGGSTTMRNFPDVACVADKIYGVYNNGSAGGCWGTSFAAPLWAAFTALVNQQAAANGQPAVGFLNPALYAIGAGSSDTQCFHDITSGNNTNPCSTTGYVAAPGYDLCTGWGTPNGSNLINALTLPPVASFSATPASGPAPLTVTFTDTSTGIITNRFWNFGDGNTTNMTTTSVSQIYTVGTYTVTLVVSGPLGVGTNTRPNYIVAAVPNTISTTSSPSAGGTTSGSGTYTNGSTLTVCATPNSCYSFVSWTLNSSVVSTSACYTFTLLTNDALVANFSPVPSTTITTSSSPAAGGTTSGAGTYGCGSNVTVCASANSCYSFVNWTLNGNVVSSSACYTFSLVANEALVANFSLSQDTITTSSSPAGEGSTSGGGTYGCGSNVTVCATPSNCYSFVSWTDQNSNVLSTSACYMFTVATNESLVANFAVNSLLTGSLTNLWIFTNGPDGAAPYAGLVQGSDSNFYGTTYGSGSGPSANGNVFRISPSGSLTNLWSFTGGSDGANPQAGLVQGGDGNFYGTTAWGGAKGYGTVFRISPSGSLTNLWSFTGGSDGASPQAGLVQGTDGNFYGTTYGSGSGPSANGTVFRISPTGSLTNLWSFTGGNDGAYPWAALVQGSDSNFYGTASYGGAYGAGTVFRIHPSGSLTNLWSFTGGNDGANPQAGLVQGNDGNFYGTTYDDGANGYGTAFRISPTGSLTNLWSFTGCVDGANPAAALVQGSDGNLYGTTYGSGNGLGAFGTVFKLSVAPPLPPLAMFTANPTNGMAPLTVSFTDSSTGTITNRFWNFGDGATSNTTATTVAHVYSPAGTYPVTLIVSGPGGVSTNTQPNYITVAPCTPPTAFTVTGGGSYCSGGTGVAVGLAGSQTGVNYQLYNGASPVGVAVAGTGSFISFGNQTVSGTYTAVGSNTTTACTQGMTGTATVTIVTAPGTPGTITQGNPTGSSVCANASGVSYTISSVSSATSYTWSVPADASITAGQGTTSITVTWGTTGGNVTVTANNTCGSGSTASLAVSLVTAPGTPGTITQGNPTGSSVCANASGVSYTISSVSGATSYTWSVPAGASITAGQGTTSITVTWGTTGGNVTVTANNAGCSGSAASLAVSLVTYTISTSSSPSGGGTTSGGGVVNCGSNVTVTASVNPCWSFVNWTVNGTVVSTNASYSFTAGANETLVANFIPPISTLTLTTLYSFSASTNGLNPEAGLVQGSDGNFYGTTLYGGTSNSGTVFKITSQGTLTTLWQFNGTNGQYPYAGLVQGSDGNFYGTTEYGGGMNNYGTVFKITSQGTLTTLWSQFNGANGRNPYAGPVQGSDGNFYGTTEYGGNTNLSRGLGCGTVFRISSSGTFTSLYSFSGSDGELPFAGLMQGSDSNFYGTTYYGGTNNDGTVFKITPQGTLTTLWQFNGTNGQYPYAGLAQGGDGNFYGTTTYGGTNDLGTVFKITSQGTLTTLWESSFTTGANPQAGLVQGSDGNFYGTTFKGGNTNLNYGSGYGSVFRISPTGSYTSLYSFVGSPTGGAYPWAGLVQGSDGNFYGTTLYGGTSNSGTVFKLVLPSPPEASFTASPTSGPAPLGVSFTDTSCGSVAGWAWAFGDGNTSTNQNPSDIYAAPGNYTVEEIVSGLGGTSTSTVANLISVYSPVSWWQLNYFGTTNNHGNTTPTADYTGTGMSNTNKFMAGFNPTNPAAYLHIITIVAGQTNVVVTYLGANGDNTYIPGIASRTNVLEFTTGTVGGSYSNNFSSTGQTNILSGGNGLGTVTNMTDVGGATNLPSRYYRIRVLLP